jgi:glycosyltransferase involved in cell wall biosynthesis
LTRGPAARAAQAAAWCALAATLGMTAAFARLLRGRRPRRPARGPIVVTGTFDSQGWFDAHVEPLCRAGPAPVIVVTDVPRVAPAGALVVCPSRGLVRLLGRAGAKLVVLWREGRTRDASLYMGYHLFPGALSALVVARVHGRPAAYQMTGGPIELAGGGYANENPLMSRLGRASRLLESLALAAVREFDLVVVRGRQAERFLAARGIRDTVAVITAAVREGGATEGTPRDIDVVFVGRLAEIKQPQRFVEIVAGLARARPRVRAVVVGTGPEHDAVERHAERLGVRGQVELLGQRDDVLPVLRRSKVFVLTSRSEGMPIALLEAMACGVVPVTADVGEVGDVVRCGTNGWLVRGDDVETYVRRVGELLDDPSAWAACSNAAREAALELARLDAVAIRWRTRLGRLADLS